MKFVDLAPRGYEAPEIVFQQLGEALVTGLFAVKSTAGGLLADSLYMLPPDLLWEQTLSPEFKLTDFEDPNPALIIGNASAANYYHWTLQCFASLLVYNKLAPSQDFTTIMPNLNRWRSEMVSILDLDGARLEMNYADVIRVPNAVRSNLTGGHFVCNPHPSVISEFEALGETIRPGRRFGKKIYASRLDATTVRRIVNEAELCKIMASHGFEVITPGQLSVEEQIVAFRDAEVVVGPHGAGLTNLLYCKSGTTKVVELLQPGCANDCYARICQAKDVDYTAIFSPDTLPSDPDAKPVKNLNDIVCDADLALIESVVSKL